MFSHVGTSKVWNYYMIVMKIKALVVLLHDMQVLHVRRENHLISTATILVILLKNVRRFHSFSSIAFSSCKLLNICRRR